MLTACMLPLRMLGLLMLMLSLCDADSICPTELNPLTLDVPRVIESYGTSVEVNCTSTETDHDGMYWRIGNNDPKIMLEESFISQSVSLSEWNMTAECRIILNATHTCSKELEITIYQNPTVNVFAVNPEVEGTLFELQCDIADVAPVQNLVVRWFKDNQTIQTDNFTNTITTPVNESSTLAVNISRAEHGAEFRCEAQLDFRSHGPQLPVHSKIYIVSVNYAPEFKNTSENYFVPEGDDVTLNCDAEGRPQPTFHWKHDGKKLSDTNNLNITRVNTSGTYHCSAINSLGNITKEIHVRVTLNIPAAPAVITTSAVITTPEPSKPRGCPLVLTPAKIVVRFGDPVSINCSTSVAVPIIMGWEVTSGDISKNDTSVTWSLEKVEDWSIKSACFIIYEDDMEQPCYVELDITLYKTPDIVSVSASDPGPMMEGTENQLKCDIINVTPVQKLTVRWYRGTDILHTDVLDENRMIPVNMSSIFNFTAERDYNGAEFKCEAELQLETNRPDLDHNLTSSSSPHTAVVLYKPLIKPCQGPFAGVEHEFSLDKFPCQADGNPPPIFRWYYDGKMINASEPLTRTQSGKYTAEVSNRIGSSNTSIDITIEYGPTFTCDDRYEVEVNSKLCEPEGNPKPDIKWFKNGTIVDSPWQSMTKHDSGSYMMNATNSHGTVTHKLQLDVLFAPEINEGTYSKEVNLDGNVTLVCSAEGNPLPDLHWTYSPAENVRETTRGHQKSLTITGATSTNAGLYICVATNNVGKVTSTVTLKMKDVFPWRFLWWLLMGLIIVFIVILIVIVHKRCKKHGRYRFIPDRANDGSDIPMAPQSNGTEDTV
ncbi:hypothetical protein OYC64_005986 [Pagothenia borchgrevinki]|uniref:Ig-like domain-containing protein n=1 Tax=Pagothenia borchgrevinki TaxID=8213 RepID=A0ABD2GHW7_PAGBO